MNLKERRALCNEIREYIATSGATLSEMATRFDVPYQTLYSISKGTNSNPNKRLEGALRRMLVTPWEEDTMPGPQDLVAALNTIRETCTCYSRCNVCPMYSKTAGGCGLMAALPSKWVLNQPEPVWRAIKTEEETE